MGEAGNTNGKIARREGKKSKERMIKTGVKVFLTGEKTKSMISITPSSKPVEVQSKVLPGLLQYACKMHFLYIALLQSLMVP